MSSPLECLGLSSLDRTLPKGFSNNVFCLEDFQKIFFHRQLLSERLVIGLYKITSYDFLSIETFIIEGFKNLPDHFSP